MITLGSVVIRFMFLSSNMGPISYENAVVHHFFQERKWNYDFQQTTPILPFRKDECLSAFTDPQIKSYHPSRNQPPLTTI